VSHRTGVASLVEDLAVVVVEPFSTPANDLQPKTKSILSPCESKPKIFDSMLEFKIEELRVPTLHADYFPYKKRSPDDPLEHQNHDAADLASHRRHLEDAHAPPSSLGVPLEPTKAAQPHALTGEEPEPPLTVACAWRREATITSHQEVVPYRVLPWVRIPSISDLF
jgi:hypothetical protein